MANDGDGVGLARMSIYDGRERGVRWVADEKETRVELLPVVPGVNAVLRILMLLRGVGVREPWKLFLRLTFAILLAGELPGVSRRLLPRDRSLDMTVETESRSCRSFASALMSPSTSSISRTSSCRVAHRRFISDCNRRISPFTVNLSNTPLSIMARTRSIAGP
jgi:hypothetical protein